MVSTRFADARGPRPGEMPHAFRPSMTQNVIDFHGRTGYVRIAIEFGVPIVPAVSIGGQETQLFLTRGAWLAKQLGLKRIRMEILPVTLGFPYGLTVLFPANLPLPAKITYLVLEPIDIVAQFGKNPRCRRGRCPRPLGDAGRPQPAWPAQRRLPVLG